MAGTLLSSSRAKAVRSKGRHPIPVVQIEPPTPFVEGPGPGREWWEKALSEKSFSGRKRGESPQNQGVGANSRTTHLGPFGELIRATGPMAKLNPFRFSTKYQDDESDLLYYGYRYLNTSTGRWLSKDPIQELGGFNLYCFCLNEAIDGNDPLGLWWDIVYKKQFWKGVGQAAGSIVTVAVGVGTITSVGGTGFGVWAGAAIIQAGVNGIGYGIANIVQSIQNKPGCPPPSSTLGPAIAAVGTAAGATRAQAEALEKLGDLLEGQLIPGPATTELLNKIKEYADALDADADSLDDLYHKLNNDGESKDDENNE